MFYCLMDYGDYIQQELPLPLYKYYVKNSSIGHISELFITGLGHVVMAKSHMEPCQYVLMKKLELDCQLLGI